MRVNLQNRPDLYKQTPEMTALARAVLIPEGVYQAELVDVQPFTNSFGQRMGLVFAVIEGDQVGTRLMESAALTGKGKLADLVAGMGELRGLAENELRGMIGNRCRIMVKHGETRSGRRFASIVSTFR